MTDEGNNPPGEALLRWFEELPQQAAALEARRREAERARAAELERRDVEHAALVEAIRRQASRLEAFADGAGLRRYALHGARYGDHMTLRGFPCEGEPTATLVLGWAWGDDEKARVTGPGPRLARAQLDAIQAYFAGDEPWRDVPRFISARVGLATHED